MNLLLGGVKLHIGKCDFLKGHPQHKFWESQEVSGMGRMKGLVHMHSLLIIIYISF